LPPVSTTPAANLPPVSRTPVATFATILHSVVDTGGKQREQYQAEAADTLNVYLKAKIYIYVNTTV
jgi:hypothetical protein